MAGVPRETLSARLSRDAAGTCSFQTVASSLSPRDGLNDGSDGERRCNDIEGEGEGDEVFALTVASRVHVCSFARFLVFSFHSVRPV